MKTPKVDETELLYTFEDVCKRAGKQCRGFDVETIDGPDQWAIKYVPKSGYMVVCGLGGCEAALGREDGYVPTRWSLLMLLEATYLAPNGW